MTQGRAPRGEAGSLQRVILAYLLEVGQAVPVATIAEALGSSTPTMVRKVRRSLTDLEAKGVVRAKPVTVELAKVGRRTVMAYAPTNRGREMHHQAHHRDLRES